MIEYEEDDNEEGQGTLFIISAPSGAGKTSLVRSLLDSIPGIQVSVSHTTRDKRPGEVDGTDYHFIDEETFTRMVGNHQFLEFAIVFDHHYGTAEESVRKQLNKGVDVILEIDWQGARKVRNVFPNAVSIFVLPPSRAALEERLTARAQDDAEVIERRMRDAVREMSHYGEFDYLLVNDDFDITLAELKSVIVAQRLRMQRQSRIFGDLISDLLN